MVAVAGMAALGMTATLAFSQLTIESPRQSDVPQEQARILLRMSIQAVAKEFRPAQRIDDQSGDAPGGGSLS